MDELQGLLEAGVLAPLDVHFARTVARLAGPGDPLVRLAAALTSHLRQAGHVCVDLPRWAGTPVRGPEGETVPDRRWPPLGEWLAALRRSAAVDAGDAPAPSATPLVLDAAGRLYLRRLFEDQQQLALALLARAAAPLPELDGPRLRAGLDRIFGEASFREEHPAHGQRRAALLAALRPLCIVTGGPGTGKTTTVAAVLALLGAEAEGRGAAPPATLLLAPTGKAAARLGEALREARDRLPVSPETWEALPREASTIHRALGPVGGGTRFRHGAESPLAADLVVVDEASMVDLPLMTRLLEALLPGTRLVLLGDRDQLASVEAGTLLGDLCGPFSLGAPRYSPLLAQAAGRLAGEALPAAVDEAPGLGLRDSIAPLAHSFRFGEASGIGRLARAIGDGDAEAALALLADPAYPDVTLVTLPGEDASVGDGFAPSPEGSRWLLGRILRGYAPYLAAPDPRAMLAAVGRFRALCAHRRGPFGAEALSAAVEAQIARDGRVRAGAWYHGRPILVTENHYGLGLWNGDVGVVSVLAPPAGAPAEPRGEPAPPRGEPADSASLALTLEVRPPAFRAWFTGTDGELRALSPARLPACEPVFATSVHKAQGSEFDEVLVVLPGAMTRVLSRELLYTAVTRARSRVELVASPSLLRATIARRIERASGLRDLLWGQH